MPETTECERNQAMTVPEWVMIALVGGILSILGWAATRLVSSNDATSVALSGIKDQLGIANGRLGKMETWQQMHGDDDARRFHAIESSYGEIWHAINHKP